MKSILCLLMFLFITRESGAAQDIVYYISPSGSDLNSGTTADLPFASVEKARDVVRELRKNGKAISPVRVCLRGGRYHLRARLVLGYEDSGTRQCPVTYSAYNDEVPVLSLDTLLNNKKQNEILRIEGNSELNKPVEYINIQGLTFKGTFKDTDTGPMTETDSGMPENSSSIVFRGARNCSFTDNYITNVVTSGLSVSGDSNIIRGNKISKTGSDGIISISYEGGSNYITRNHISDCGIKNSRSAGIRVLGANGVIANNLIHGILTSGIVCAPVSGFQDESGWLFIEFNEIRNIGHIEADCSGIHITRSHVTVRNNLVINMISNLSASGSGIFLEGKCDNIKVESNIVYRNNECISILGSCDNLRIANNYFIESENSVFLFRDHNNGSMSNVIFVNNIIYFTSIDAYVFYFNGKKSLPDTSDNNIFWNPRGCLDLRPVIYGLDDIKYFSEWIASGYDNNSIKIDPGFVDLSVEDFNLNHMSVAHKVGITRIDVSEIGLKR